MDWTGPDGSGAYRGTLDGVALVARPCRRGWALDVGDRVDAIGVIGVVKGRRDCPGWMHVRGLVEHVAEHRLRGGAHVGPSAPYHPSTTPRAEHIDPTGRMARGVESGHGASLGAAEKALAPR